MYKRILSICLVLQLVASSSFAEVEQSQEAEISMLSGIKYALWDLPSEATNSAISTAWYYTPSPIKTAVVYLFPFVLATVAEKNVAKPLADLIKTYSVKDTKLVKNSFFYSTVAGRALFTWATNTLNRALFGPTEAVINEAVKDLNAHIALTTGQITEKSAGIELANVEFTAWAEVMNSKYSIQSQQGRANVGRCDLYIQVAAEEALKALDAGHVGVATAVFADALIYFRQVYGEFSADNLMIASDVRNSFSEITENQPSDFAAQIIDAVRESDKTSNLEAEMFYNLALLSWGIAKSDKDITSEGEAACPAINLLAAGNQNSQSDNTEENGMLEDTLQGAIGIGTTVIAYSPGFVANVGLSIIESSPLAEVNLMGVVTLGEAVKAVKGPLVTALSDKATRAVQSSIQKWVYGAKNSHIEAVTADVEFLSTQFDEAQSQSYNLYSNLAANARANYARAIVPLVADLSDARHWLMTEEVNIVRAAKYIAKAVRDYRVNYNEAPVDFAYTVNAAQAFLSNHVEFSQELIREIKVQLVKKDVLYEQNINIQASYDALLTHWGIVAAE